MEPQNPYTVLLERSRDIRDRRKGGGGDDPSGGGSGGSGSDPTPVLKTCMICGEDKAAGYTATCCGNFLCSDCLQGYAGDTTFGYLFKREGGIKCVYCNQAINDLSQLTRMGVPQSLLGGGGSLPMAAIPDAQAWQFTLQHGCGAQYVVLGWEECDVLTGGCSCGERNLNLIGGPRTGHSYQMRDFLGALQGYHRRSSAQTFAALRTQYPMAWAAFHLDQLINLLAGGGTADLSMWNPETVEFLTAKAADIKRLLGI